MMKIILMRYINRTFVPSPTEGVKSIENLFQNTYCNYLKKTHSKSYFSWMIYLRNLSRSSLLHRDHETSPRFCPLIHSPDMIWRPSAQDGWSLSWFIPMLNFQVIRSKTKHNKITSCFQNVYKLNSCKMLKYHRAYVYHTYDFFFFSTIPFIEVHITISEGQDYHPKGKSEASLIWWEILNSTQLFIVYFGQLFEYSELHNYCTTGLFLLMGNKSIGNLFFKMGESFYMLAMILS